MSVYDAMAPAFDRRRPLPSGVPEAIRDAVLRCCGSPRPRVLDLGAGAGRIGWPFVLAGDNYVGADLSLGMLRAFAERAQGAYLAQADGARLPFGDAAFDAVLLVQVLSGARGWRHVLADVRRVLRPGGALIVGRVIAPDDGIDALMKARLEEILAGMEIHPYRDKPRDDAMEWLARTMPDPTVVTVACWMADRTPRGFLERHVGGARFSVLPEATKQDAMRHLADWATGQFGSCDKVFPEPFRFELTIHRHDQRDAA